MSVRKGGLIIAGGNQIDNVPTSGSANPVSSGGVYTALSGKADTDLSNLTATGRATCASIAMPSNTYDDLTLGASGTVYTAPANGYVLFAKTTNANNQAYGIFVLKGDTFNNTLADVLYGTNQLISASGNYTLVTVPIKSGKKFIPIYSAGGATQLFRFVYAE